MRSIFQPGFMYSHDSLWHVERIQNIFSLVPHQFPVRWSPTLDNGYGIPLFNFAYPAPYYLGAFFMFLGLGPIKTYYALLFLAYFLGGVGVYLLGRRNRLLGFTAAILYLLTPYQLLDIFVRGALGEVVALGLIPWVILSYQNISRSGKISWYSPLPMALLFLSHNFYAYLFTGLLTFFVIFLYRNRLKIIFSHLFSVLLSSFFLLPAFFEKSNLLITQTANNQFTSHFVYPAQLIYSKWIYLGSVIGNSPNEMSFQLGIANLVIGLVALGYFIYLALKHSLNTKILVYLTLLAFAIFMTLPQSILFWFHLPLISSLQFPWRFIGPTAVLFTLLFLELGQVFYRTHRKAFQIFAIILVAISLFNTRNYHRPVKWMTDDEFLTLHYEYAGKNTTAHRDELVPRWAPVERWQPEGSSLQVSDGVETRNLEEDLYRVSFLATAPDNSSQAIYYKNYFPSWEGHVDSAMILLSPSKSGEIIIPLSEGEHTYTIEIVNTPIAKLGNLISVVSLLLLTLSSYWLSKLLRHFPRNQK